MSNQSTPNKSINVEEIPLYIALRALRTYDLVKFPGGVKIQIVQLTQVAQSRYSSTRYGYKNTFIEPNLECTIDCNLDKFLDLVLANRIVGFMGLKTGARSMEKIVSRLAVPQGTVRIVCNFGDFYSSFPVLIFVNHEGKLGAMEHALFSWCLENNKFSCPEAKIEKVKYDRDNAKPLRVYTSDTAKLKTIEPKISYSAADTNDAVTRFRLTESILQMCLDSYREYGVPKDIEPDKLYKMPMRIVYETIEGTLRLMKLSRDRSEQDYQRNVEYNNSNTKLSQAQRDAANERAQNMYLQELTDTLSQVYSGRVNSSTALTVLSFLNLVNRLLTNIRFKVHANRTTDQGLFTSNIMLDGYTKLFGYVPYDRDKYVSYRKSSDEVYFYFEIGGGTLYGRTVPDLNCEIAVNVETEKSRVVDLIKHYKEDMSLQVFDAPTYIRIANLIQNTYDSNFLSFIERPYFTHYSYIEQNSRFRDSNKSTEESSMEERLTKLITEGDTTSFRKLVTSLGFKGIRPKEKSLERLALTPPIQTTRLSEDVFLVHKYAVAGGDNVEEITLYKNGKPEEVLYSNISSKYRSTRDASSSLEKVVEKINSQLPSSVFSKKEDDDATPYYEISYEQKYRFSYYVDSNYSDFLYGAYQTNLFQEYKHTGKLYIGEFKPLKLCCAYTVIDIRLYDTDHLPNDLESGGVYKPSAIILFASKSYKQVEQISKLTKIRPEWPELFGNLSDADDLTIKYDMLEKTNQYRLGDYLAVKHLTYNSVDLSRIFPERDDLDGIYS